TGEGLSSDMSWASARRAGVTAGGDVRPQPPGEDVGGPWPGVRRGGAARRAGAPWRPAELRGGRSAGAGAPRPRVRACTLSAPAAEAAMARLETGALETSTLAAMLLLLPALLAVACDGHACAREKSNS